MERVAIKVSGVYKDFLLPHERVGTVKGLFTGSFKRSKNASTQHALKDINLEIKKGEFFGIVGRNGSGKSTLLKMLAGIYQPTKGNIKVNGKLVPFIELGVGFNPELTGRENVYLNGAMLGFSKAEVDAMYDDIVNFAELKRFMDQKLKNYSSGMQVRLAFSMAIRAQADILLVDEVLAVGDADFQRKCFRYFKTLKKNKSTVVFVSHDMGAIQEYCDRAMLIDKNKIQMVGKPTDIAKNYAFLFLEDEKEEPAVVNSKRWGNGRMQTELVKVEVTEKDITVCVEAVANSQIDSLIYGLHIAGQDGQELTAMNNRMILHEDIKDLQQNDRVRIKWRLGNIFNDGRYFVTITLVDDENVTLDWLVDAATFTVKRMERSTTAILPPIEANIEFVR